MPASAWRSTYAARTSATAETSRRLRRLIGLRHVKTTGCSLAGCRANRSQVLEESWFSLALQFSPSNHDQVSELAAGTDLSTRGIDPRLVELPRRGYAVAGGEAVQTDLASRCVRNGLDVGLTYWWISPYCDFVSSWLIRDRQSSHIYLAGDAR
jgi:hypothetical protein